LLAGVFVFALGAGALAVSLLVHGRGKAVAAPSDPVVVPPLASMVPIPDPDLAASAALAPADEGGLARAPSASASAHGASHEPSHGKAVPASAQGKSAPSPSAEALASASASPSTAAPVASAAPSTDSPAASVAPPKAADAPAVDPSFDAEKAYVEIGMINADGVKEHAVRAALHNAALSQCYKSALRVRGSRATGVATLNLSFDEGGAVRSAILTGADFLPALARCVQDAASAVRIGKVHVEPGGGVAEVTLGFREP
jgi:hypothetical protein